MRPDPNRPATALLHNMSAPSKSVIQHTGRHHGRRLLVRLPEGLPVESPAELLTRLDGLPCSLTPEGAELLLRGRLDVHARALPLPSVAAVDATGGGADAQPEPCSDLLTVLTILAKCSGHVYLRDKAPVLEAIQPGRSVLLILPTE